MSGVVAYAVAEDMGGGEWYVVRQRASKHLTDAVNQARIELAMRPHRQFAVMAMSVIVVGPNPQAADASTPENVDSPTRPAVDK